MRRDSCRAWQTPGGRTEGRGRRDDRADESRNDEDTAERQCLVEVVTNTVVAVRRTQVVTS